MVGRNFEGRVALVTGAGSGVGYAHAGMLSALGAKVMVQDLRASHGATPEEKTAQEVCEELRAAGNPDVDFDTGDVSEEDYCVALVEKTVGRFGRIDVLLNNAGAGAEGTVEDSDTERMMRSLKLNLFGSYWPMRTALPHMKRQNYGRIVNTSSATAALGSANMVPYVTAKGALMSLTRGASLDYREYNIKVNTLCPIAYSVQGRPYFDARPGVDLAALDPKLVSPVALYLCHEDCTLNGEVLSAGSGVWARIFSGKTVGVTDVSTSLDDVFDRIDEIVDHRRFNVLADAQSQYKRA